MAGGGKGSSTNETNTTTNTSTVNQTTNEVSTSYTVGSNNIGLQGADLSNFLAAGQAIFSSAVGGIENVADNALNSQSFANAQLASSGSSGAMGDNINFGGLTGTDISLLIAAAGLVLLMTSKKG